MVQELVESMSTEKPALLDRLLEGLWDRFEAATEWLKDVVDTQPWTHFFLFLALWFTIVWLKDRNMIFHLAWLPWAWYGLVIAGAPLRIGLRY